jgi:hypothetical protein
MQILFVNQYFPSEAPATAYLLGELAEDLAHQHVASVIAGRPNHNPESIWFVSRDVHVRQAWSTEFRRANMAGRLSNYAHLPGQRRWLQSARAGARHRPGFHGSTSGRGRWARGSPDLQRALWVCVPRHLPRHRCTAWRIE